MKWYPIETAPKTMGEIIELNRVKRKMPNNSILVGRANSEVYGPGIVAEVTLVDGKFMAPVDPVLRRMLSSLKDEEYTEIVGATHWGLLPSVPTMPHQEEGVDEEDDAGHCMMVEANASDVQGEQSCIQS